ncbi:MAG: hypothetical protein VX343_04305 [Thermodesulfobacteriota bacterium]|nr:hypothetical protein [Thermodesulfobacteriota bacterium]
MSRKSALLLYQSLEKIDSNKDYWEKYIKFHEMYWDGPASTQNVYYGREYEEYRISLSNHLEMEAEDIKDCLFTKHENGRYYLTPLGDDSNKYILESENIIPPQWFFLFANEEKKFFYSHAGDGAVQADGIYYVTDSASSKKRLNEVQLILTEMEKSEPPKAIEIFSKDLEFGISELNFWLSNFDEDSMLILNYAELNTIIHEFTLKNENSVQDLWFLIKNLEKKKYNEASSDLKIFKQKWSEIGEKSSTSGEPIIKNEEEESIQ